MRFFMADRKFKLNDFYTNVCDEDSRLVKDKSSSIEFITTVNYIDKYLKPNSRILEVGAGTGRYSLYYAEKGYKVNAIEIVNHNVKIMKSNIKKGMDIKAEQGDALDLSRFEDNTFDITLVLGPLYHLCNKEDQKRAINEAIRVTKPKGIIMFAYLTSDSMMVTWALGPNLTNGLEKEFDAKFKKIYNEKDNIFAAFYIQEFENLMKQFNIKKLKDVATDGMSEHLASRINALTDEQFDIWVKYHLSTCERKDLQGYSNHMLYICKKSK